MNKFMLFLPCLLMKLRSRPYHLLLFAGILFVLLSFFTGQNDTTDIHLHDTYLVIGHAQILWFFAFLALLIWFIYTIINRFLYSRTLAWIHIVITLIALSLLAWTVLFKFNAMAGAPRRYEDWSAFDAYTKFNQVITTFVLIAMFAQLLFLLNFLIGVFKSKPANLKH